MNIGVQSRSWGVSTEGHITAGTAVLGHLETVRDQGNDAARDTADKTETQAKYPGHGA